MIQIVANGDGTFTEYNPERPMLWIRDRYVYQLQDMRLECVNCKREIIDSEFFICLDLGDCAHIWCVKVDGDRGGPLEGWP